MRRLLLSLLVLVAAFALVRVADVGGEETPANPAASSPSVSTDAPGSEIADRIETAGLPSEVGETVALVAAGGPFPYDRDDTTFGNREGRLPDQRYGYYREYTVPTPGSPDRGARRLVVGAAGEVFYTDDHYGSFTRIGTVALDR